MKKGSCFLIYPHVNASFFAFCQIDRCKDSLSILFCLTEPELVPSRLRLLEVAYVEGACDFAILTHCFGIRAKVAVAQERSEQNSRLFDRICKRKELPFTDCREECHCSFVDISLSG
ncbi:hypothetical protein EBE87_23090 [Pseudoroseomonas wenyumeiae]|uniref:Uncharacterized protein n=1 Tax=Teichococcus wenyumeiae TaxID=2478470 RepID=A0A3A9JDR7_9PROT|nr:hypothetical protein D6Z83_08220 [Pseudoroseomonas wenyumeiae]RMI17315.1 hypothetical protein EBE87_23090 [Pseudoroseomonas wenyumeiae]